MFKSLLVSSFLCIAIGSVISGCGSGSGGAGASGSGVSITGAGSTFVYPVLQKWVEQYQKDHPSATINYQPKGSGAGISQYQAGTVDFGASDAPLSDEMVQGLGKPTLQIPVACGCVVLSYNIKGINSGLKLSGDVIADIYLGKINSWNDPRIVAQNPGTPLPNEPINVVHRSDASGTTYIFTSYLSAVSSEWKTKVGADKAAAFPVGIGGAQSSGVAGQIKQNEGAIGYVELAYTIQTQMPFASIRNAAGSYVDPTLKATEAAETAMAPTLAKDLRTPIVNAPGKDSYPIAGLTYALVSSAPTGDAAKNASEVVKFLKYCIQDGQQLGAPLQYAPLPQSLIQLDLSQLEKVKLPSPASK